MGYFTNKKENPRPISSLAVTIGEESEIIAFVASPGEPDVRIVFVTIDNTIASAETIMTPPAFISLPVERKGAFAVTGRKVGSTVAKVWAIVNSRTSRDLGQLMVTVGDFSDTSFDMFYLGKHLVWRRSLPASVIGSDYLIFSASSGDMPVASAQGDPFHGPIPEGSYRLLAQVDPLQGSVQLANSAMPNEPGPRGPISNVRQGIQFLPIGGNGPVNERWGTMRVRLEPLGTTGAPGRGGFYLHNSHKGFTSGCVEVGRSSDQRDFFSLLLEYASKQAAQKSMLTLKVMYRSPETSTRGDTQY